MAGERVPTVMQQGASPTELPPPDLPPPGASAEPEASVRRVRRGRGPLGEAANSTSKRRGGKQRGGEGRGRAFR
eukprot:10796936-Alexandrium_andersonii.AAC.1